ncbi:MAG: DUF4197 domain-containing protein [Desulfobacterales bacterium]
MHTNLLKHLMYRFIMIIVTFFITFSLIFSTVEAGNNWLDKGKDLLKTYGGDSNKTGITVEEIVAGLKDALRVGSENVVARLGRVDGFNSDPAIHIPLPRELDRVKSVLDKVGMSSLLKDLELKLNRAAEIATPKAKKLFLQAITEMSFDDVKKIYEGPKDAATQYFKNKMSPALSKEMEPIVNNSLSKVGAIQAYDGAMKEYRSVPFVPDAKADLTDYVVEKGMDGIFYYMAEEEAAIRTNPAKRTTDLLKRVFGAK